MSKSLKTMQVYPEWVIDMVRYFVDGEITDEEFTNTMKHLITERMVRVG